MQVQKGDNGDEDEDDSGEDRCDLAINLCRDER